MSEKLYGGKCHICTHLIHTPPHSSEPIAWLDVHRYGECDDCSFCQAAALVRALETQSDMGWFDPEVRRAVDAFHWGRSDPILDKLRIECQALTAHVFIGGERWEVADAQYDSSDLGAHLHLTVTRAAKDAST